MLHRYMENQGNAQTKIYVIIYSYALNITPGQIQCLCRPLEPKPNILIIENHDVRIKFMRSSARYISCKSTICGCFIFLYSLKRHIHKIRTVLKMFTLLMIKRSAPQYTKQRTVWNGQISQIQHGLKCVDLQYVCRADDMGWCNIQYVCRADDMGWCNIQLKEFAIQFGISVSYLH